MISTPVSLLFADDSATMRRLLNDAFTADPELQICLAAHDGQEAVTHYSRLSPDVVLLDVEMPVLDGIETVAAIRKLDPRVPIIMFSTLTSNGAEATLDALTSGATDYVTKPVASRHISDAFAYLRSELIPKIKHWGRWYQRIRQRQVISEGSLVPAESLIRRRVKSADLTPMSGSRVVNLVAIGVSTGGPNALAELLKDIPADFPAPILITQHMPVLFTKLLAERLNHICPLHVREGLDGAVVAPGDVWIAPGDYHMIVESAGVNVRLHVHQGPQENSCRPAVDVMFRSIASTYRERALAVVLTGMGQDGLIGCQQIRERGGQVLAQDEASSVVWGMPRAVAKSGLADRVVPLSEMAHEISRIVAAGQKSKNATRLIAPADSRRV